MTLHLTLPGVLALWGCVAFTLWAACARLTEPLAALMGLAPPMPWPRAKDPQFDPLEDAIDDLEHVHWLVKHGHYVEAQHECERAMDRLAGVNGDVPDLYVRREVA